MESQAAHTNSSQALTYPFQLPKLKFGYADLEPYMDQKTVEIHHSKHHQAYINALNAALKDYPQFHQMTIEELLRNIEQIPAEIRETVRNQGGGHANHQFLWKILKPGPETKPEAQTLSALNESFGSFENFKKQFTNASIKFFGAGWIFLVVEPNENDRLKIFSGPNHESVLYHGTPGLLICDLWEHAYYLKHQNRRADYIEAFWNLVDWSVVEQRLIGIRAGKKQL